VRGTVRLARDANINPTPPRALALTGRSIGRPCHDDFIQAEIKRLTAQGARDFRLNQQQVTGSGQRVGLNRPDLQYTLRGGRHYLAVEGEGAPRGLIHQLRITANDPDGVYRQVEIE
jgi:hypothetical protein